MEILDTTLYVVVVEQATLTLVRWTSDTVIAVSLSRGTDMDFMSVMVNSATVDLQFTADGMLSL